MMKRSKAILLSLLFLVMLLPASHAQDLSTQGKEFWLSFISNGFKYHPDIPPSGWVRVQLLVSAKRSCEGTILNPNTGWRHNFTVEANNTYNSQGPSSYTYNMKQREDGIYFFVATSKEGTVAKKVVIQK